MIDKISLYGFKSYVNQNFSLRPLTILTGLNSSGKSSVIQAVRILNNVTVFKNQWFVKNGLSAKPLCAASQRVL